MLIEIIAAMLLAAIISVPETGAVINNWHTKKKFAAKGVKLTAVLNTEQSINVNV